MLVSRLESWSLDGRVYCRVWSCWFTASRMARVCTSRDLWKSLFRPFRSSLVMAGDWPLALDKKEYVAGVTACCEMLMV